MSKNSKDFYEKLQDLGIDDLTNDQISELKKLAEDITDTAKSVVDDYEKNPSDESGSLYNIHQDSPYMEEKFPGKMWESMKKVGNQYIFSPKNAPKVDSRGLIIENKLIDNETHSQSLSSTELKLPKRKNKGDKNA
tara:strand:- start:6225 stop:6632 length:408 start_codon:yes stop_codon:yes gene_type:complete